MLDKLASKCYNIIVRKRSDSDREIENYFKILQKALDKLARICYNILVREVKETCTAP